MFRRILCIVLTRLSNVRAIPRALHGFTKEYLSNVVDILWFHTTTRLLLHSCGHFFNYRRINSFLPSTRIQLIQLVFKTSIQNTFRKVLAISSFTIYIINVLSSSILFIIICFHTEIHAWIIEGSNCRWYHRLREKRLNHK